MKLFESIKRFFNGEKKDSSLKLYKNSNRTIFLKEVTLCNLSSEHLNELISILVDWYRIRMPDKVFIKKDNDIFINDKNISYNNYKRMNFDQLLKRNNDLDLLKCNYRGNSIYSKNDLSLNLYIKSGLFNSDDNKVCTVYANRKNGKITRIEGDYLLPKEIKDNYTNYTLHELLNILDNKNMDNLNYDSLIECINNRENDLDVRNKIIDIVCLELFNSEDEDYGFYRAFTFLKEISNYLELKLNSNYLDNFIDKFYSSDKVKEKSSHKIKKHKNTY